MYKIYFDMDGVLVDFPQNTDVNTNRPTQFLDKSARTAKKKMWQDIEQNTHFWRDLPEIPNIKTMLRCAMNMGEIFVLSKTPNAKNFIAGQDYVNFIANEKRIWILKKLPIFFDDKHIIICDTPKGELIKPDLNHILVDDRIDNIQEWENAGGIGVLFNRDIPSVVARLHDVKIKKR
jgi:5'(3')-deoxyribonucleotidase